MTNEAENARAGDVPRQTPLPSALGKVVFWFCSLHPSLQHGHRGAAAGQRDLPQTLSTRAWEAALSALRFVTPPYFTSWMHSRARGFYHVKPYPSSTQTTLEQLPEAFKNTSHKL